MNTLDEIVGFSAESITCQQPHIRDALRGLVSNATEVVVFGSRAVGVHSLNSDLDLLIVTPQKRRFFADGLDCVLIAPGELNGFFWLGSELASHVAHYGMWVEGSGKWKRNVCIKDRAITRKQQRIYSLLRNGARRWPRLHPVFQDKYRITIRIELQRLNLLLSRIPIPPTPLLDSEWQSGRDPRRELFQLSTNIGLNESYVSELELVFRDSDVRASLNGFATSATADKNGRAAQP